MSLQKALPYFAEGIVVSGFGRGSKELGIPTANFPDDVIQNLPSYLDCGVYYGWAKISSDDNIYKMVMSVGWNPYYHNTVKTMETHIIHKFDTDFYGDHLKVIVLGYIRPMLNFKSLDDLIAAIHNDIGEANKHLQEPESLQFKDHQFFAAPPATVNSSALKAASFNACDSSSEVTVENLNVEVRSQNGDMQSSNHMNDNCAFSSLSCCDFSDSNKHNIKCGTQSSKNCKESENDINIHSNQTSKLIKDESCNSENQELNCQNGVSCMAKKSVRMKESENKASDLLTTNDTNSICRL